MYRRINVTLPEDTIRLIDRVSKRGNRSRLINQAVRRYVANARRGELRKQLKQGALHRAERDLRMAEESFFLEEESCRRNRR